MKIHELKLRETFADAVLDGDKTFEIRRNDRGFQTGDCIRFKTIGFDSNIGEFPAMHEIDDHLFRIKYILNGWGLRDEYVALAIEDLGIVTNDEPNGGEIE